MVPEVHSVLAKAPGITCRHSFNALLAAMQRWPYASRQAFRGQKAHSPGSGASAGAQPQQLQPQLRQLRGRAAWQFPPRRKQCRPVARCGTWQTQPQRWREKLKLVSGGVCLAWFTALAAKCSDLVHCITAATGRAETVDSVPKAVQQLQPQIGGVPASERRIRQMYVSSHDFASAARVSMHVSALQEQKYVLPLGVVHSQFRALMRALIGSAPRFFGQNILLLLTSGAWQR